MVRWLNSVNQTGIAHRPLTSSTTTVDQNMSENQPDSTPALFGTQYTAEISACGSTSSSALKRTASSTFESDDQPVRKRLKEDNAQITIIEDRPQDSRIADELSQELHCGCCAELAYRPVLVMPCQHFFCGRSVPRCPLTLKPVFLTWYP